MATPNNKSLFSTSKNYLTTAASVAASVVVARSIINDLLPSEVRSCIQSGLLSLRNRLISGHTIVIPELEGGFSPNLVFTAAKAYLATKIPPTARHLNVSKLHRDKTITLSVNKGEEIIDVFEGVEFTWRLICTEKTIMKSDHHRESPQEIRSYVLSFHQNHKVKALESYLPFILERAEAISHEEKKLKLHMNDRDMWFSINLHHPATFETLAMESELKKKVLDDLERFVKRKDYYRKIGKAWKRGYLLYGPPGTGKSSLIAAMANYLKFDIYFLELTAVGLNSSLQRLMVRTTNKSVIVVEDIDCSVDLTNRGDGNRGCQSEKDDKVTLSGLLNFVDGLWSSCGEERIIVFTTNYKEKLDPALLRPGRMDMHIHMGYCTPCAFRVLASNYHGIGFHQLFGEIEELIQEVEVTPAQVAEELLKSEDATVALQELIKFLQGKKNDAGEVFAYGE